MSDANVNPPGTAPYTIHCPGCRGSMRIAVEHVNTPVACPHCQAALEPWRLIQPQPAPPTSPAGTPPYGASPYHQAGYSWRNRWIAGALGVLLGGFGVHRFYMGYTGIGIAQIVVTVVTLGTIGPIWGFIEGILCFCGAIKDVDGLELRR